MNRCFPDPQALLDLAVEVGDSVEVGGKSVSDIVGDEIGSNLQVRDLSFLWIFLMIFHSLSLGKVQLDDFFWGAIHV
jgi:hypothetical protein